MTRSLRRWVALSLLAVSSGALAQTGNAPGGQVAVAQSPGARVPVDIVLTESSGARVRLEDLLGKRPVLLTLVFYRCTSYCDLELTAIAKALRKGRPALGKDLDIVTVSIHPHETVQEAAKRKAEVMAVLKRPQDAPHWRFFIGDARDVERLATSVGYLYSYDPKADRVSHPTVIMVLTPDGRVSRYMFGVDYPTLELEDALQMAARGQLAKKVEDPVLLGCLVYDPSTGGYRVVVGRLLQVAGAGTVLILLASITVMALRNRRQALRPEAIGAGTSSGENA
jgi:protein SCO1/2